MSRWQCEHGEGNSMKKYLQIVAIVVSCAVSSYAASKSELRVGGTYLWPSDDFWKSGGGANIQWRYSVQKDFALAVSLGIQKLDVSTDEVSADDGLVNAYATDELLYMGFVDKYEGDATLVPLGASAIYDIPLGQAVLSLEAGLKYVFVSSSVKANMLDGVIDSQGNVLIADMWKEDVEIGNNLLGSLGAQINIPLNQQVKLYIGGGYQFDIVKGDVELKSDWSDYDGIKTTENKLGSAFAEAGIAFKF